MEAKTKSKTPKVWQNEKDRTIEKLVKVIYDKQKVSSKSRKHSPPSYTYEELLSWVNVQPNFKQLFKNWVDSNCNTLLIPSVDRRDDSIGYTLDNLFQVITWQENKRRGELLRGNGTSKHPRYKEVHQFDLNGNYLKSFHSAKSASEYLNSKVITSHILDVCNGLRNKALGFMWSYDIEGRDIASKQKVLDRTLQCISVCGFTEDEYVEFASAKDASVLPNVQFTNVLKVIHKERPKAGGYTWKRLTEYLAEIVQDISEIPRNSEFTKIDFKKVNFNDDSCLVSIAKE